MRQHNDGAGLTALQHALAMDWQPADTSVGGPCTNVAAIHAPHGSYTAHGLEDGGVVLLQASSLRGRALQPAAPAGRHVHVRALAPRPQALPAPPRPRHPATPPGQLVPVLLITPPPCSPVAAAAGPEPLQLLAWGGGPACLLAAASPRHLHIYSLRAFFSQEAEAAAHALAQLAAASPVPAAPGAAPAPVAACSGLGPLSTGWALVATRPLPHPLLAMSWTSGADGLLLSDAARNVAMLAVGPEASGGGGVQVGRPCLHTQARSLPPCMAQTLPRALGPGVRCCAAVGVGRHTHGAAARAASGLVPEGAACRGRCRRAAAPTAAAAMLRPAGRPPRELVGARGLVRAGRRGAAAGGRGPVPRLALGHGAHAAGRRRRGRHAPRAHLVAQAGGGGGGVRAGRAGQGGGPRRGRAGRHCRDGGHPAPGAGGQRGTASGAALPAAAGLHRAALRPLCAGPHKRRVPCVRVPKSCAGPPWGRQRWAGA